MVDIEYDLIVVGAGTGGIPCAVTAAQGNAHVLLLDKEDEVGGSLHISGGHMSAAGARRQRDKGIEDTVEAHRADIHRISAGAREDLLALATDLAAPTLDWLEDNGFEFDPDVPRIVYGHEPYLVARTYYGPEEGRSVLKVLKKVLDEAVAKHKLEIRLSTPVKGLSLDEKGDVNGVILGDGTTIHAKNTVLATGGFGANAELFKRLEKTELFSAAWPTSTGDGLIMAEKVGGAIANQGTYLPSFGGLPSPNNSGVVRFSDRPALVASERPPYDIYVDRSGNRWIAEDEDSIDKKERALARLEKMTFWTIFDSVALEKSQPMMVGWSTEKFTSQANKLPGIFVADTLEELAKRAGIDPVGLAATVAQYNADLAQGRADKFGRTFRPAPIEKGPFYSIENHGVTLITFSGLDVDSELRVRRENGQTFGHLYAIGELLGAGIMGKSFVSGMAVMPAMAFGKWLGAKLGA